MKGLLPLQLIVCLLQWQSVSSSWYCRYQSLSPPRLNNIFGSYYLVFGRCGVTPHCLYRGSSTLMLLHLWKQPPGPVRYLRKSSLTICHLWSKNPLVFSITLILTINNLVIKELFAENRFLKNTSTWLLQRSKFYSEFDSMFCLHKVRILQKGFSHLSLTWSVKWCVSLKLRNNHSRDWINNFPCNCIKIKILFIHKSEKTTYICFLL